MGSVSSDDLDQISQRFESYRLSADVSESESSSAFSGPLFDDDAGSASTSASVPGVLPGIIPAKRTEERHNELSEEVQMMKEQFAKLLLGEDMSGRGKGVCTALAISNAITNLSASVFGELWKLEALPPQKKILWQQQMGWLLSVTNSIVELIPSMQELPGAGTFEVMATRQRSDLHVNLPALKKLDAMLLGVLDGFHDSEFNYVDRGIIIAPSDGCETFSSSSPHWKPSIQQEEKWWLPFPKVPCNGLSKDARKRLLRSKECTNQILKASMAINSSVLAEMEVPVHYLESLPKNEKDCLGEDIYCYLTAERFSLDCLLDYLDLSSQYNTIETANRIEAAVHIWKQKYFRKCSAHAKVRRSSWGGKVKGFVGNAKRNNLLAQRAETVLQHLRLRSPGLPQTDLDISKIQYNKDVGLSILESYSRVMKGLAFNILARTDDILYVDGAVKLQQAAAGSASPYAHGRLGSGFPKQVQISPGLSSISKEPSASSSMRAMSYLHAVPVSTGQRTPYPLRRNLGQPMKRMAVIS